ncbi:MAG: TetR/AcrR family transcriptional regulator [Nocardioides sp.]
MPRSPQRGTPDRVLDAAQELMMTRGWSAVSYADLAAQVGIKTASIHHHFPGKAELGRSLIERYNTTFQHELVDLDDGPADAVDRLRGYLAVLRAALTDGRSLCLCTMLAAEYEVLPAAAQRLVIEFNEINIDWLTRILIDGASSGVLKPVSDPAIEAQVVFSEAQGAQLLAHCYRDPSRYDLVTDQLVARLRSAS